MTLRKRYDGPYQPMGIHEIGFNSQRCHLCGIGPAAMMRGGVGSWHWTGRAPYAPTPWDMLRGHVRRLLWPSYNCRQCVGQEEWRGCYCAYYGAPGPGEGPSGARVWARGLAQRWLGLDERGERTDDL